LRSHGALFETHLETENAHLKSLRNHMEFQLLLIKIQPTLQKGEYS